MGTPLDLPTIAAVAERAAVAGGVVVRARLGTVDADRKSPGDYVTDVDRESEAAVASTLGSSTPDIPIVGEERGGETAARYWLVDPLDGTTNFVHGFRIVGVSVALIAQGAPVVGVVHAPFWNETYRAWAGGGAWLVRPGSAPAPLTVSDRSPEHAVVGTGFPFRHKERLPRYLSVLRRSLERFEDLRRPGAASLDLAWVAAGTFEGFFELGLSPWDVAAGSLLVQEAGGVVSDWSGGAGYLAGDILAGSPGVHRELLAITGSDGGG